MRTVTCCPHCRGDRIYHQRVTARHEGFDLLPGIGEIFHVGEFDLYACADCGNVQFFIIEEFLDKIPDNWEKVQTRLERHG